MEIFKAMGHHKRTSCMLIASMVTLACSSSSMGNNELRDTGSLEGKPPVQLPERVDVDRRSASSRTCYDSQRNCYHYERKGCASPDVYHGTRSSTIGGAKCQEWKLYGYLDMPNNYCRNPYGGAGPWCWTEPYTDIWDYCFTGCKVDNCYDSNRDCFFYGKKGCTEPYSFIGTRNHTLDGTPCQDWTSHGTRLTGNLCRDIFGGVKGPYCYINSLNSEWNYCYKDCNADVCYDSSLECFHYGKSRCRTPYSYLGKRDYTMAGNVCSNWTYHSIALPKNYCRKRFGGEKAPWCYTEKYSGKWEYCFPDCKAKTTTDGKSCGKFWTKSRCKQEADKCGIRFNWSKYRGYCDPLPGRRHHCICCRGKCRK